VEPTVVGLLVLGLGLICLFASPMFAIATIVYLSLFGSAAAINMPALGGASVPVAPFFAPFVAFRALLISKGYNRIIAPLSFPKPGFWLVVAVLYGGLAAFLIAPHFYNEILVYPIARSEEGIGVFLQRPLQFSSGNITQTFYAIGEVVLFGAIGALASTYPRKQVFLDLLVNLGIAHILLSAIDLATFYTNTGVLIDWLRSANYQTWQSATVAGMKRLSAFFPEASLYSIYGMTIAGIMLGLVLSGYRERLTRVLFACTLVLLLISTSSTAYIAVPLGGVVLCLYAVKRAAMQSEGKALLFVFAILTVVVTVSVLAVLFVPQISSTVNDLIDKTLVNKLGTDSGADRSRLNEGAFQTLLDSIGLGVGLGGARTSSFVLTLLSNLGVFGACLYALFLLTTLQAKSMTPGNRPEMILRRASRFGMIGGLIGASISLSIFELGPLFYILAAFAALNIRNPINIKHIRLARSVNLGRINPRVTRRLFPVHGMQEDRTIRRF